MNPITIAALDDHDIVHLGLRGMVAGNAGITLIATGHTPEELIIDLDGRRADVALVDVQLHNGRDVAANIEALAQHAQAFVVYTSVTKPVVLREAIVAGALGVALKGDPPETLIETIMAAAVGDYHASSDIADALVTDPDLIPQLAPREIESLQLLREGFPKKLVGRRMVPPVSENTVTTYVNRIMARYREIGRPVGGTIDILREAQSDGFLPEAELPRGPQSAPPSPR